MRKITRFSSTHKISSPIAYKAYFAKLLANSQAAEEKRKVAKRPKEILILSKSLLTEKFMQLKEQLNLDFNPKNLLERAKKYDQEFKSNHNETERNNITHIGYDDEFGEDRMISENPRRFRRQ